MIQTYRIYLRLLLVASGRPIAAAPKTPRISHPTHRSIWEGGLGSREALAIAGPALAMLRLETHVVAVAVRRRVLRRGGLGRHMGEGLLRGRGWEWCDRCHPALRSSTRAEGRCGGLREKCTLLHRRLAALFDSAEWRAMWEWTRKVRAAVGLRD
jgi:hypothetical protein